MFKASIKRCRDYYFDAYVFSSIEVGLGFVFSVLNPLEREAEAMEDEQIPFLKSAAVSCNDIEELLSCYIDGEMIAPLQERFEGHLKECDSCRGLIDDCRSLKDIAATLDEHQLPHEVSLRLREALRDKVGYNVTYLRPRLTLIK